MKAITGLDVNLLCFRSCILEFQKGATRFFAPEWKRFFDLCGWENACTLFGRLNSAQANALEKILMGDVEVVQLWAEEGEKNAFQE